MDITNVNLEARASMPYFKPPYTYGGHNEIDVRVGTKLLPCYEIYAKKPKQPTHDFALGLLGGWLSFYDPDIVVPPQQVMNTIKFKLDNVEGTIGGHLATHTINTLIAQQQIQKEINGSIVADLGSGSGIQAIAALKLGAAHAILIDLNPDAIKEVKKLMAINGFGQDRYTAIHDSLASLSRYKHILSSVGVVIANIGSYSEYGDADLKASQIVKYAPNLSYYIAGGYRCVLNGYIEERDWTLPVNKKAEGEEKIVNSLEQNGLKIAGQINSHRRGEMMCARTFIAKSEKNKSRGIFKGINFTFLRNTK